jgi:glycine/D-amino acid oxidase-like deaminating enzyme
MSISLWQADEQTLPVREVDFLVVGAGLVGCAVAHYATQTGCEVVITEKQDVAMGASGRNAGFMITGLDTYYHRAAAEYGTETAREMWQLSRETIGFWREIAYKHAVRLENTGSLLLAESAREARDLEKAARALDAAGIDAIYHDSDPLGRGYHAAIEQPGDAAVQPYHLTQAVLKDSGAELVANNEVYRMEQTAPDCVRVYTRRYIFEARYVVLCTNAYSPLIEPFFYDKIIPTRAQCLATEPLDEPVISTCGYSNYGYMYYRMTFDGRFLIGGGRHKHVALENDTSEDRINAPVQQELERYMQRYFPDVTVPVARRWSGIMGFSVDGLPIVGTLPDKSRVGYAVGFNGHGLALGAGTAKRAVEQVLNQQSAGAVDVSRLGRIQV